MSTAVMERPKLKTIGFGHAPEREGHHFVVVLSRSPKADVLIYEVFERDLVGPQLDAANLRCKLNAARWLKLVDALQDELNSRLRSAGMKPAKFKIGENPVARLLGKELMLLAWAMENADPSLTPAAIQNWLGLAPEERWWLYTMTAAQTAHYSKHNIGWRKAVRFALTENPVAYVPITSTSAEHRHRKKRVARDESQGKLFKGLDEGAALHHAGNGIWEELCEFPLWKDPRPSLPQSLLPPPPASLKSNSRSRSSPKSATKNARQTRAKR